MKVFLLFVALIGLVLGQGATFKASLAIRNDPAVVGTVTGTINYNLNQGRLRIDYSPPISISEFFEFSALTNVRFLVCPGTCQAETIKVAIPRLLRETADVQQGGAVNVNGRSCTRFNKANVVGGVTQIFVDGSNFPCRAVFNNGKVFDFTNPTAVDAASFGQRPSNCPVPVCTKKQDMMLVFDESGSVNDASFAQERKFGVDLANQFNFGAQFAAMGLVQFDTVSRLTILLTQDKTSFINQMNVVTQNKRATCIGCGIITAQNELFSGRGRSGVIKVMIILTDGQNNVDPPGSNLATANQNAKNAGIIIASIAVAQASDAQVSALATSANLFFRSTDFSGLANLVTGLSAETCTDIPGNNCGAGCKGFCSCNQQCLCPQLCETTNQCQVPFCNNNQNGAGCQFPAKNCNDQNACTNDLCNPASGCFTTPVDCNDNNFCTDDSCNPAIGCVRLAHDCTKANPCFTYSCTNNVCVDTPVFCDLCTLNNVTCPPIPCQVHQCNPANGQCRATPKLCNSNSQCIIDGCLNDVCTQTPVNCDDGNACTIDTCDAATGCIHTPIDPAVACDDQSVCTENLCDPQVGCINPEIPCNSTGSACIANVCNSIIGCQTEIVDCGAVLRGIDPNKQGDCYIAACDDTTGCFLSQIDGTSVDRCGFCAAPGTNSQFCFLGLDVNQAAGLGGGIIAAIVIGIVAAVIIAAISGKKGYDVWRKNRQNMQGAQTSPMYVDPGRSGNNPFFEQRA